MTDESMQRRIAKLVTNAREAAGMSQRELAERSGIPQTNISRLENGRVNPTAATLDRLAYAMDTVLKIEFAPREKMPWDE